MTRQTATQTQQQTPTTSLLSRGSILQRKCESCGQHTIAGGECTDCAKKKSGLQRKLAIGASNDPLEREADRVADRVMAASAHPAVSDAPPRIQRYTGQFTEGTDTSPASVERILSSPGRPLDPMLKQDMEQRFGYDFSRVRVHTGTAAEQSAKEVNAKAYTVGHNIVFGDGQFAPGSHTGRHLIAHELTHVVQQLGTDGIPPSQRNDKRDLSPISTQPASQVIAKRLARKEGDPVCEKNHPLGENVKPPQKVASTEIVYLIWGTWQKGDTPETFVNRTCQLWIKWRFKLSSGKEFDAVLGLLKGSFSLSPGGFAPDAGCQAGISVDKHIYALVRKLSGEADREKAVAETKAKADTAVKSDPSGTEGNVVDKAVAGGTNKDAKLGQGGGSIGGFGFLNDAVKEATALDQMPSERIKSDITVLKDSVLSNKYLQIQEHYTGRSISAADRTAASDGLDAKEIESIEDGKPMRRAITALFTQGWREFTAAGESDKEKFMLLEQLICEQFTRGNPTAIHNQMKIGKGVPENTFGIVERGTNILLYNDLGVPLPGFGGVGFRDRGYIASRADDKFGFNIANVKNPGLRSLLNSLRQTFGDPFRMAIGGAEMYFKHINAVNEKVLTGLSKEVIQKFEDMLPYFVGFLAGHAVSTFLMRVPNPYVAGVGLSLKALLVGAGYIMDIDFGPGALDRLMRAAAFLSKFEENDKHQLSELSEGNLTVAAKIIQEMVAEIAVMFATAALGKLLRRAHAGKERFKIECTHCDLDGPGTPEAKGETKKAETGKGEIGKTEADKTPETPTTKKSIEPVELSKPGEPKIAEATEKLEKLKAENSKTVADLKQQRAANQQTIQQFNKAIDIINKKISALSREAYNARTTKGGTKQGSQLIEEVTTNLEKLEIARARKAGIPEWKIQAKVLSLKSNELEANNLRPLERKRSDKLATQESIKIKINELEGIAKVPDKAGGSHQNVRDKSQGGEVNHMPAHSAFAGVIELKYGEGPAIWMTKDDHMKTTTWGSSDPAKKHREKQQKLIQEGKFKEALQMDIDDVRAKFPDGRYEKGIQQLLAYVNVIASGKLKPKVNPSVKK